MQHLEQTCTRIAYSGRFGDKGRTLAYLVWGLHIEGLIGVEGLERSCIFIHHF